MAAGRDAVPPGENGFCLLCKNGQAMGRSSWQDGSGPRAARVLKGGLALPLAGIGARLSSTRRQVRPAYPPDQLRPDQRADPAQDLLPPRPALSPVAGRVLVGDLVYQSPCADGFRGVPEHSQDVPVEPVLGFGAGGFNGWINRQGRSRMKAWIDEDHGISMLLELRSNEGWAGSRHPSRLSGQTRSRIVSGMYDQLRQRLRQCSFTV